MSEKDVKLICFDLNKTLIEENTWEELNIAMGMSKEEDEFFLRLYEEGVLSYKEWQVLLAKIYKVRGHANLEKITEVISRYTYRKGAKEVVKYLKDKGCTLALISGSMDILVDKVAKDLDFELFEANNIFVFNGEDYLEDIVSLGDGGLAKLRHLESFCRKLGIKLTECACVGDGANDIELFQKSRHGITFEGSEIEHLAWKVIDSLLDLKNIF